MWGHLELFKHNVECRKFIFLEALYRMCKIKYWNILNILNCVNVRHFNILGSDVNPNLSNIHLEVLNLVRQMVMGIYLGRQMVIGIYLGRQMVIGIYLGRQMVKGIYLGRQMVKGIYQLGRSYIYKTSKLQILDMIALLHVIDIEELFKFFIVFVQLMFNLVALNALFNTI